MAKKKSKGSKKKRNVGGAGGNTNPNQNTSVNNHNKRSIPTREPVRNVVNAQSLEENDFLSNNTFHSTGNEIATVIDELESLTVNPNCHSPVGSISFQQQQSNKGLDRSHQHNHCHHHESYDHHRYNFIKKTQKINTETLQNDNSEESQSLLYESSVDDLIVEQGTYNLQEEQILEFDSADEDNDEECHNNGHYVDISYNPENYPTPDVVNNDLNDVSTRFDSMSMDLNARIQRFAFDIDEDEQEHEDIEDYRPGGYCPIKMFDILQSRYSVIMKLGWGHFSTVWLCWDMKEKRFVAIKVMKSADNYREAAEDEVKLLRKVRDCPIQDGKDRIVALYDNFILQSINGTHICMVFEVLGGNLLKLIIKSNYRGIPLENVRTIIKQVLSALHYLHTHCGIIHTDMKPENVLLVIPPLWTQKLAFKAYYMYHHLIELPLIYRANVEPEQLEAEQIRKNQQKKKNLKRKLYLKKKKAAARAEAAGLPLSEESKSNDKITSINDNGNDKYYNGLLYPSHAVDILNDPETLLEDELKPVDDPTFKVCDFLVKVADLGNACWREHHFTDDIQTRQYRAPEVIIGADYDISADIWSVACLAFELATGDYLFDPRVKGAWIRDGEHLSLMKKMLGPMPKEMIARGRHHPKLFFSDGTLRFERLKEPEHQTLFSVLLDRGWEESIAFTFHDFLSQMLHWEPEKRSTAEECLQHPFIVDEHVQYEHIMSYIRAEEHLDNELSDDSYDERYAGSAN